MDFQTILNTISTSDLSQWQKWETSEIEGGLFAGHHGIGVYKPNPSIQIIAGRELVDNYKAPWANSFPDPTAKSVLYLILWNGFPIYESSVVFVDGFRAALPNPKNWSSNTPTTTTQDIGLARIVHSIIAADKDGFDGYLERALMKVIE
jgi:hypothetical protein